jgi:DNA-binding transcriptional ArsR family regulator
VSHEERAELERMIFAFRASQCIYVAAALGLADHLAQGSRTLAELAALTGTRQRALERLLRALEAIGLVEREGDGRFALTALAGPLRRDAGGSLREDVLHALNPASWMPWGRLLESVRSGDAAFPLVFGCDVWAYRAQHPEVAGLLDAMAAARSRRDAAAIVAHLDLPPRGVIVDVGGGTGELLARLLAERPQLAGVLFDLPQVVAGAAAVIAREHVGARCRVAGGDFFREVPAGGDLYLLKAIVHNWDDGPAARLLANCRRAMPAHARLVLIESVVDLPAGQVPEFQDLHMLVIHGGRERSTAEFGELLRAAGFRLAGVDPIGESRCLITGAPD